MFANAARIASTWAFNLKFKMELKLNGTVQKVTGYSTASAATGWYTQIRR